MKVTVLMPVYNAQRYLREAIVSILGQTYQDFEFLIVNDGSTDNSESIIRGFDDVRIRLINNKQNEGLPKTLNRGIRRSRGEYIVRMDADDVSYQNRIEKLVSFMDNHADVDICGSAVTILDGEKKRLAVYPLDDLSLKKRLKHKTPFAHPSIIIRRQSLIKNKLYFDPKFRYAEDYEFFARGSSLLKYANLSQALLYYRWHSSQRQKDSEHRKYVEIVKKMLARPKLLYILPEYDEKTPMHHYHIFEMLEELGKKLDIFLIVEKSVGYPGIKNLQKIATPKNIPQRLLLIIWARILGYQKAYVHYSYLGAILSSFFMKTYYWHCEVYDKFFSDFKLEWPILKKKILDEYLMVLTLKMVDYLVTGTKTVGKFYQKQFNLPHSKIKIIPNWINLPRFLVTESVRKLRIRYKLPEGAKIVLFAHKLVKRKGADYLPQIISRVSKKINNVLFLIAGPSGDLTINFKDHYKLLGPVPNKEIPAYMKASDIFIMPSRQEGFPRVLIEAMAAGIPFVATDTGGTRDILTNEQKKYLTSLGDMSKFSHNICYLLGHEKIRKALCIMGQNQAKKYDLGRVAEKFVNLLS
jgi:glycosyltransferase involved in cell wall biosynthesis